MPLFNTATLRRIGGWDPYNVTEDADLGMRFARFGYRSEMIWSATYEEAPAQAGPWLRQRTRWFKGWMQTVKHPISPIYIMGLRLGGTTIFAPSQRHRNIFRDKRLQAVHFTPS